MLPGWHQAGAHGCAQTQVVFKPDLHQGALLQTQMCVGSGHTTDSPRRVLHLVFERGPCENHPSRMYASTTKSNNSLRKNTSEKNPVAKRKIRCRRGRFLLH